MHDEESLIEAVKQVNVVICAVNSKQVLDQKPLISAIKKAGCIEVILHLKIYFIFSFYIVLSLYFCTFVDDVVCFMFQYALTELSSSKDSKLNSMLSNLLLLPQITSYCYTVNKKHTSA